MMNDHESTTPSSLSQSPSQWHHHQLSSDTDTDTDTDVDIETAVKNWVDQKYVIFNTNR